jgi:MinD-like ATPase involved in chromosome partitioning or flagellar assembly/tetratricopeptide (TPR) repeat protein
MFTTFYSYKGGVGRSLALANVAWLLANHPTERARVLAIDFDLNAPGLHKVFGMAEHDTPLGIVDFVETFVSEAKIDDISAYIHKTQFPDIDILPAGLFDPAYQARLESINWKELYESAHGFEFINRLKQMIAEIQPAYDYVLIDSLTGYSDVGGICVRQLPDCVVLLFRLNNQNLDGIKSVYKSIRSADRSGGATPVIPVITPAWPFLDSEAKAWYEKAKAVFPFEPLNQISFDGGLSFGESIVSKSRSLNLPLTVLTDYESLALRLRSQNARDPLTMWNSLKSENLNGLPESFSKYQRLLTLRPDNGEYWQYLPNIAFGYSPFNLADSKRSVPIPLQEFGMFVDKQCDLNNKFALLARARFEAIWNPKFKSQRIEDLDKALELDAEFFDALMSRGQIYLRDQNALAAIESFKAALGTLPEKDKRRGRVFEYLGAASLDIHDGDSAVDYYLQALSFDDKDSDLYAGLSRAYYLTGKYEQALAEVEKFRTLDSEDEITGKLLPVQILAAMGEIPEATVRLDQLLKVKGANRDVVNIAEAYLAVDPTKALKLFERSSPRQSGEPLKSLKLVARIFTGDKKKLTRQDFAEIESERNNKKIIWSTFELFVMLKAAAETKRLTAAQISLAEEVLRRLGPMLPTIRAIQRPHTLRN